MQYRRWPKKNAHLRVRFQPKELNRLVLKSLLAHGSCFSFEDRAFFFACFQKYYYKFSISFFRNSCLFTGYSKSVFRLFKMSRHCAKSQASNGVLVGMRKSSF